MDKTIKQINRIRDYYIKLKDSDKSYFYWDDHRDRGTVFTVANMKRLLQNEDYFNDIVNQGFNLVIDLNRKSIRKKIPISMDYIRHYAVIRQEEKQRLAEELESYAYLSDKEKERNKCHLSYLKGRINGTSFDTVFIYRKITSKEIQEFYEFSSKIEISGLIVPYNWIFDSRIDCIYIDYTAKNAQEHELYEQAWGKAQRYSGAPDDRGIYYRIPVSKIDKVIGIKKNLVIETFDQDKFEYTGESEKYVLDLHHFDESTYQLLKSYGIVELEDTDKEI